MNSEIAEGRFKLMLLNWPYSGEKNYLLVQSIQWHETKKTNKSLY
jgi:hypothetical protein